MKETFYFSHDYNSRTDDKIKKLLRKHNLLGYGVYWAIIEDLYNNANALQTDYEGIAFDLRVDSELIKSIIKDFDLFVIKQDTFYSDSVNRRLDERANKSASAKASADERWRKHRLLNANALQTQSKGNAIKERKGNKGKEIKDNKDIPTYLEFENYALSKKNVSKNDLKLKFESWVENGWKDGNDKKIVNWKSKLLNTMRFIDEIKDNRIKTEQDYKPDFTKNNLVI